MISPEWISALANVVMAVGIILVWYQASLSRKQLEASNRALAADHERSRRELTLITMYNWNKDVGPTTAAAERLIQRFTEAQCRDIVQNRPIPISKDYVPIARAVLGELLPPDQPTAADGTLTLNEAQVSQIRYILADYLNILETTFTAWQLGIVDTNMIEQQFQFLLSPQHGFNILEPFRTAMGGVECYPSSYAFMKRLQERYDTRVAPSKSPVA